MAGVTCCREKILSGEINCPFISFTTLFSGGLMPWYIMCKISSFEGQHLGYDSAEVGMEYPSGKGLYGGNPLK